MSLSMNLSSIPIFDHHAHPLWQPAALPQDAITFQRWFSESTDPEIHARHVPHNLFFRTAVRWLAELLACDPAIEAVLAARAAQPADQWAQQLLAETNLSYLLCDYGYGSNQALSHDDMQNLFPCPVRPILRLETLAQDLILRHDTFEQVSEAFVAEVGRARANGYVALKSIIAYRTGLAVAPVTAGEAATAFAAVKEEAEANQAGHIRLASKPLCDYFLWLALEQAQAQSLPVQFHTGFGDSDADLRTANPLHLRQVIESFPRLQTVLLHAGWPFYRETAHLASIYGNVWLDLSLAIPFATTGIPAMLRDVLGMAPFSKLLFATDAFTMPEIYYLAARWGRWGLGRVLAELVSDGFLTEPEAWQAAEAILAGNSWSLYSL